MDKYNEVAADIIDDVCEIVLEHYTIEVKDLENQGLENPALINGVPYYDLEQNVASRLRKKFKLIRPSVRGSSAKSVQKLPLQPPTGDPTNQEIRAAIEGHEGRINGYYKLGSSLIKAVNLKKGDKMYYADIKVFDDDGHKMTRYNDCDYPKNVVDELIKKRRERNAVEKVESK